MIGFGIATIAVVGVFARWLFASTAAGIAALALYAVLPGSVYYARTFQPDVAMVFFLTAGLYAFARWTVDADGRFAARGRRGLRAAQLAFSQNKSRDRPHPWWSRSP